MARTDLPNLILCDVELAGVGGTLVLYAVRRDPKITMIPFILMSGFAVIGDTVVPGGQRGADGFLAKPFTPTKLNATIAECLDRQQKVLDGSGAGSSETPGDCRDGSGLLHPLKQVLEATRIISTAYQQLELKEIAGLATKAHQAASHLYQKIENWLPAVEAGK